jgi:hypothetical protein
MLSSTRGQWAGGWIAAVIITIACSVVAGAQVTASAVQLWLVAGVVPPAIMLLLRHGAPPLTAAHAPSPANRIAKDGRQ